MVEDVAQFSVRGGIFDIYSFGMAEPVRLEFWGDDIAELRHFDLLTQRSTRDAELALILPVDGQIAIGEEEPERSSIRAIFPPDTLLVVPAGTQNEGIAAVGLPAQPAKSLVEVSAATHHGDAEAQARRRHLPVLEGRALGDGRAADGPPARAAGFRLGCAARGVAVSAA